MEVFTTYFNSISNSRFDPNFHHPKRLDFFSRLEQYANIVPLKDIIKEGNYGILPPGDCYNYDNPIIFIRATELKPNLEIDFENALRVPAEYFINRAQIKKNDILLAVKGATIASGKCVSFCSENVENSIINGSIFRFQVKSTVVPKYVAYLLNSDLLKRQMHLNLIANNAVDYLDKSLIENLLIPIPNLTTQKAIVLKMDEAYSKIYSNKEEALKLIDSIDDYILSELNIHFESNLNQKIFPVELINISNRLDPFYYQPGFLKNYRAIDDSTFEIKSFNQIVHSITNGFDYRNYVASGTPYLKVSNIKKYRIDKNNCSYVDYSIDSISKNIKLGKGSLLLTRKGTFGIATTVEEDMKDIISSEIFNIKLIDDIDSFYISAILNSPIGQIQFSRVKIGAIMGSLSQDSILSLKIPVPPIDRQIEISQKVKSLLSEAENLQKRSSKIIEDAKNEVEQILFKS